MGIEEADRLIREYSPVANDIDEALCNMGQEVANLRAEVGRLEKLAGDAVVALLATQEIVSALSARLDSQMQINDAVIRAGCASALAAQPAEKPAAPAGGK